MIAKRIFDTIFAGIGLVVLSPLFLLIAIWIKLDSSGPVFFRQERVGRFGRTFRIHKFRSMSLDAPSKGLQITAGADPRITRSGRFIRAYKLDELPQLIDVFLGNMSLVGPRPEVPRYVAHYPDDVRAKVLSVRPGITDLASVEFRDENDLLAHASDPESEYVFNILPTKLRYYCDYVDHRSFGRDVFIILLTFKAIVVR